MAVLLSLAGQQQKKGNYNQNAFKRSRGFGCCPKHTVCSLHPPLCDASIWGLQPPGRLWHVQQAAMQGRRCRCRSLLAKWKGRATSLLQALLLEVSVPHGKSCSLTKLCSRLVQPPSPTTSRETLFLEVTQLSLQMSAVLSPPGKKLPIAPEV